MGKISTLQEGICVWFTVCRCIVSWLLTPTLITTPFIPQPLPPTVRWPYSENVVNENIFGLKNTPTILMFVLTTGITQVSRGNHGCPSYTQAINTLFHHFLLTVESTLNGVLPCFTLWQLHLWCSFKVLMRQIANHHIPQLLDLTVKCFIHEILLFLASWHQLSCLCSSFLGHSCQTFPSPLTETP